MAVNFCLAGPASVGVTYLLKDEIWIACHSGHDAVLYRWRHSSWRTAGWNMEDSVLRHAVDLSRVPAGTPARLTGNAEQHVDHYYGIVGNGTCSGNDKCLYQRMDHAAN